jgi:murein DD-endopeptidase
MRMKTTPPKRLLLALVVLLPVALLALGAHFYQPLSAPLALPLPATEAPADAARGAEAEAETEAETTATATQPPADFVYTIARGDTLSTIFERLGVAQKQMYQVLESDASILALDTLQPGDQLAFRLSGDTLEQLELIFSPAHQVVFSRVGEESFEYDERLIEGEWKEELIAGEINGSFYVAAKKAGLSALEVQRISNLLQDKINFRRDLRAGDLFQVVRARQFVDGEPTGNSRLEGLRIINRARELTAFMFDGHYYDLNGESLARAFLRYPTQRKYRLSSRFNPKRKHPVTGRIRPHNGTDFATPVGTPVVATGDGVVTRVQKHPYAGLYIVIEHGQKYRTRYLHLSKALVSKGQTVSRGQKIALSGNSGRSTGAHLHYELHISGRPVDAMRAAIPVAAAVGDEDRVAFNQLRNRILAQMEGES